METTNKVMGRGSDGMQREWARIVAQAWADPDFRKRLENNPRAVLKERGVDVPANVNLDVVDKPLELQDIERAIKPIEMAVAAGFVAPPMPAPQMNQPCPPTTGMDFYSGGYPDPSQAYAGAGDPTLEGKGKIGLCFGARCINACLSYQWGAGQPYPAQQQMPQAPYWPPQGQYSPTAGDIYSSGAVDPTLEGKFKFGLCISTPVAGVCAYFHKGAGQPFPEQAQMPQALYYPPQVQQPPTAGDIYSYGAVDPTLEGKGKVGLCFGARCINACLSYQWGAGQPYPAQQQMPQAQYWPPQGPYPPTAGDVYSSGAVDPALEGKFKFGLCISTPVAGVCAYFHKGAAQPFPEQAQIPQAPYWPQQGQYPPTAGDIYSSGAVDPTLEGKFKFGLCISTPVAGVCAYFHKGAGQPFPEQAQMPQALYYPPQVQQPPTAGDIYSSGAIDPTLEGKGKVGLCFGARCINACLSYQWGAGQPYLAQQQITQAPYYPPQGQYPPTAGDIYSAGAVDPTLEGKFKFGLCISTPVAGVCAYFHKGAAQPFPAQQQQMPQGPYCPPQQQVQQPPATGDMYWAGAADPTLEGKWKFGLCISTPVAGVCAYFHKGAAQPFPAQQQQPETQPPTPATSYGTPAQSQQPTAGWAATVPTQCFSGAATPSFVPPQQQVAQPPMPAASYGTPAQPQQPTAGWAATVPTQCFSGAATPSFVPPGHPSQQPIHILPSQGPQTRPANPGPQTRPANPGSA
jgi:hypothetical protein